MRRKSKNKRMTREDEKGLSSVRPTLELYQWQRFWEILRNEMESRFYGLSRYRRHRLELNLTDGTVPKRFGDNCFPVEMG